MVGQEFGQKNMRYEFNGFCPICEAPGTFVAEREDEVDASALPGWFRGSLKCTVCRAPPRERIIADALAKLRPNWRDLSIHESSPGGWAFSYNLKRECSGYVPSQYDPTFPFGDMDPSGKWRNEDLEAQTFADNTFDVVITQDVFEHVFHPGRAMREIGRTLKPGGVAVMTVPVVRGWGKTERRAALVNGEVVHILPPQYHGNPVGDGRALVTVDWSYHIGSYLAEQSGLSVCVSTVNDLTNGIQDPFNTLIVAHKAAPVSLDE